jgi:hypothetical protein
LTEEEPQKRNALEIAGIRVSWFSGRNPREFVSSAAVLDPHSEVTLHLRNEPPPPFPMKGNTFDSGQTWSLFHSGRRLVLQNTSLRSETHPSRLLVLDPDLRSGELHVNGETPQDIDPLGYPLNQVLWILLLSQGRGTLFHACGIDDNGKGYLFLGNSGDGKSTMAKLWFDQGGAVLNDDRIMVRKKGGALWMYGTPWHGDFKEHSSHGLPVQKLFFLRHGTKNSWKAKRGAESVSMLLTRSFPPFWDKAGMEYALEFCQQMASKIPCYELAFVRDRNVIDFVRSL